MAYIVKLIGNTHAEWTVDAVNAEDAMKTVIGLVVIVNEVQGKTVNVNPIIFNTNRERDTLLMTVINSDDEDIILMCADIDLDIGPGESEVDAWHRSEREAERAAYRRQSEEDAGLGDEESVDANGLYARDYIDMTDESRRDPDACERC